MSHCWTPVVATAVVVVGVTGWGVYWNNRDFGPPRPIVPAESLILTSDQESFLINGQIFFGTRQLSEEPVDAWARRYWRTEDDLSLSQLVKREEQVEAAGVEVYDRAGIARFGDGPDVDPGPVEDALSAWRADDGYYLCVRDDRRTVNPAGESVCPHWSATLRFGQYVISVDISMTTDKGLTETEFQQLVEPFAHHANAVFGE